MPFYLKTNKDGNGACPLCQRYDGCIMIKRIKETFNGMYKEGEMEIVIYKCSRFEEN
jgi:hypothetical protein